MSSRKGADLGIVFPTLTDLGGAESTSGVGLASFAGRNLNDLHYDTVVGRSYILAGAAGAGFVTETFDGTVGTTLNGKTTTTGGKVWFADPSTLDGLGAAQFVFGGSAFTQKASVSLDAVPQSAFAVFQPDTSGGNNSLGVYLAATTLGLSNGPATNGYHLDVASISGPGPQSKTWTLTRRDTFAIVATGSVDLTGADPLTIELTRSGADLVTAKINGELLYSGTPGAAVGNRAGISLLGTNITPKVLDFTTGDLGTLAWVFTDPQYFQAIVPGAIIVANHVLKPGIRMPGPTTVRQFVVRFDALLSGGDTTVIARRFNGGIDTGDNISVTVLDGQSVGSTLATILTASGDMWKFDVTLANGSPTDMLVALDTWG